MFGLSASCSETVIKHLDSLIQKTLARYQNIGKVQCCSIFRISQFLELFQSVSYSVIESTSPSILTSVTIAGVALETEAPEGELRQMAELPPSACSPLVSFHLIPWDKADRHLLYLGCA